MQTLSRQLRRPQRGGDPLPSVFSSLSAIGADPRRGEVCMIVGQPSSGKSLIAQWSALKWTMRHDLRGIYWSADATARPAAARAVSMITQEPLTKVHDGLDHRDPAVMSVLDELSERGFQWVFDGSITADSLELNIDAFREAWGTDPDWVVLDNLTDVDTRDGDEFSVLRATVRDVNYMARDTNAGMIVLHHTSEEFPENPIPPRKAIHGKVSVKPTVILGTARTTGQRKPIGVLKNRYGDENKWGTTAEWFAFDPVNLTFGMTGL